MAKTREPIRGAYWSGGQLLGGWAEIAACMGRPIRTMQFMESKYGFPVFRRGRRVWSSIPVITEWITTTSNRQRREHRERRAQI